MILAALALAGCTDRWAELDPRPVVANMFGAHLEGREPPPGLDGAYPRLSSVPPRPEPPDPAARARLSSGLADDRAASRDAVIPAGRPVTTPGAALGAAPPAPPRLAAMPPIRLDPVPARPEPAAMPVPAPAPAAPLPAAPAPSAAPEAAPAALAPPPPPPRDLLAPPPPPRELLAPRRD